MSFGDYSSSGEEEESFESEPPHATFGHEFNYSYIGQQMETNEIVESDLKEGNISFPIDFVLDHRYQIKKLIGRGTFCLVWLAYDHVLLDHVAIKILTDVNEDNFEEFIINKYLSESATESNKIVKFHRMFYHENHGCLVFELVAQNILTFINYYGPDTLKIPKRLVKKIVKDTLEGLHFMHSHGVIHTDLKPENVACSTAVFPYEPIIGEEVFNFNEDDPNLLCFKLCDLGNSCFADSPINDLIQTRQYRSPEVLLGLEYDFSADIWSLACMTFELATCNHLFNPKINGNDEETDDNKIMMDGIHLSMISSVIGPINLEWASEGIHYGELYKNNELIYHIDGNMPSLYSLLLNYNIPIYDAVELAEFLEPMLSIIPAARPTAQMLLDSPFFNNI